MRFYLIFLFIIEASYSFAQLLPDKEKDKRFDPKRYDSYAVTLSMDNLETVSIKGIGEVDLTDARADNFVLGYLKKGLFGAFKKIRFSMAGISQMTSFAERLVKPDSSNPQYTILLVVKELWLSEEDTDYDSKDKIQDADEKLYTESYIKVTFDLYLRDGESYFPVCRFDSVLTKTLPLKIYAGEHIGNALRAAFTKVTRYDLAAVRASKKGLTHNEVKDYNNERFRLAILKDSSLNRGVYNSFEEFKSNNPSITEYEIQRGKLGDELYTKSAEGRWLVTRSAWGYCDGTTTFIKSGDNYFELYRLENSFYFNGSKVIVRREVMNNNNNHNYLLNYDNQRSSGGKKIYRNPLSPMKVNVETGGIY